MLHTLCVVCPYVNWCVFCLHIRVIDISCLLSLLKLMPMPQNLLTNCVEVQRL